MNRRTFLGTIPLLSAAPWLTADEKKNAAKLIPGKSRELDTLVEFPAVLETPLTLLRKHSVTPVDLLFIRNNQQPKDSATLRSVPLKGWKLKLSGMVNREMTIDASVLQKLPTIEHEMVLQCSGNGRSLFSLASQTKGTQWHRGGIANVRFGGVKLSSLLRHLKITIDKNAKFVTAEGHDTPLPKKEDFEHSIPLQDVLDHSFLATKLNGMDLPAIHGGPLRLITPGYYATNNVKWLSHLRFVKSESTNYNHAVRYRTPNEPIKPGSEFKFTLTNSTPTWKMKVGTLIFAPEANAKLRSGRVSISGGTFNDGEERNETVEEWVDQGRTWHRAEIEKPKSAYAWTPWKINLKLTQGKREVWARAIDTRGRSQPLDGSLFWNPRGYQWNGVEKVSVTVRE